MHWKVSHPNVPYFICYPFHCFLLGHFSSQENMSEWDSSKLIWSMAGWPGLHVLFFFLPCYYEFIDTVGRCKLNWFVSIQYFYTRIQFIVTKIINLSKTLYILTSSCPQNLCSAPRWNLCGYDYSWAQLLQRTALQAINVIQDWYKIK